MSLGKVEYQEKLELIDTYAEAFLKGKSATEVDVELSEKFYDRDADDIFFKAKKMAAEKIGPKVFEAFKNGKTKDQISNLFRIDQSIVDQVVEGGLGPIRGSIRKEAQHMLRNGIQPSDIVDRLAHPLISMVEVEQLVGSVELNEEKLVKEVKEKSNTGLLLIAVGLVVNVASVVLFEVISLYLVAILIAGIIMFFRSYFLKK